jgi:hypothetical protein
MSLFIHSLPQQIAQELNPTLLGEITIAALLTALLYGFYRRYPEHSARAIKSFQASTRHAALYIALAMIFPVVVRLAVLPWMPPPEPSIQDEFSHLLVADTLLLGRLANPPHPLAPHLETIYVLQRPTYSSIYPIGQGVVLATGKLLAGNPWAGVLLATALMCGAITWMLYGCLPPAWAAIGGLIAACGLGTKWEDTYYGGAFCAFGGALLFGALCRLRTSPSKLQGFVAGLGWSIVWLVRPFESLPLLLLEWGLIAVFIFRGPRSWRPWVGTVALVLSVQISTGLITTLHNRAVTGSVMTLPYQLAQRVYGVPQNLLWQPPVEAPAIRFKELRDMYDWQRLQKDRKSKHPFRNDAAVAYHTWAFFVSVWYYIPLALLPLLWRDSRVYLGVAVMILAIAVSGVYPFFFPYYIAAYSCVIYLLVMRGMMSLFQWRVGRLLGLFLIIGALLMGWRNVPVKSLLGHNRPVPANLRTQASARLLALGGRHVVFVTYGANHDPTDEWVYNTADIDNSPIVWCRTMGPADDIEVARYYGNRRTWLVDVNPGSARVTPYQLGPQPGMQGTGLAGWVLERGAVRSAGQYIIDPSGYLR